MKKYVNISFYTKEERKRITHTKDYQFLTDIQNLIEEDAVVVDTANGLQVGYVIGYDEVPKFDGNNVKWVVQRVDLENHKINLERQEKLRTLKQKMENRRKKLEEIQIYEILSKEDSYMKDLLDEFNKMNK